MYLLIELYDNMPTNQYEDCKITGDLIKKKTSEGMKLIDILIKQQIEFVVYEVGECIMDLSYDYYGKKDE